MTTNRSTIAASIIPIVYGLILLAGELAGLRGWPLGNVIIAGGCLVVLLLHAAITINASLRGVLIALSLAALIRVASLTLPFSQFPPLWRYVVIGVPILAAAVLAVAQVGTAWAILGLNKRHLLLQILIGIIGIPLGLLLYTLLKSAPLITSSTGLSIISIVFSVPILFVFTGFLDAFIFAGLTRYTASKLYGKGGILFAALIFTIFHLNTGSLPLLPVIFIASLTLFTLTDRTGSFVGAALAQGTANVLLYLLLPLIH